MLPIVVFKILSEKNKAFFRLDIQKTKQKYFFVIRMLRANFKWHTLNNLEGTAFSFDAIYNCDKHSRQCLMSSL
jgi:hypothetical protein